MITESGAVFNDPTVRSIQWMPRTVGLISTYRPDVSKFRTGMQKEYVTEASLLNWRTHGWLSAPKLVVIEQHSA